MVTDNLDVTCQKLLLLAKRWNSKMLRLQLRKQLVGVYEYNVVNFYLALCY